MINISCKITGDMDIDLFEVDIECPRCGFYNPIWMKQARLRDTIICRGCKSNIHLDDSMNSIRKARNNLLKQLKQIEDQINKINRF